MINEVLDLPPAMQFGFNGAIARHFFEERKRRKAGTFCCDFVKILFENESENKEWMELYDSLFSILFKDEKACQTHIDKKIIPNIKSMNWKFILDNSMEYWTFDSIKPAKFRDYANHADIWCPVIHVISESKKQAVWASCGAFDSYDSYDNFTIFENFEGLVKDNKAVSGLALYDVVVKKFIKKAKMLFSKFPKITNGKYSTDYDAKIANKINISIQTELKNIPNCNAVIGSDVQNLGKFDNNMYEFQNEHIYGFITGKEYKKLFMTLGVDEHTKYTIKPDESIFPRTLISGKNPENECTISNPQGRYMPDILYSPETITKHFEDKKIYQIVYKGWTRYSVPFIPDGENKKRWQPQIEFWNPSVSINSEKWTIENLMDYKFIDEVLYRDKHDKMCTFIPKPMSADKWIEIVKKYEQPSYKRTWDINREKWGKTTII